MKKYFITLMAVLVGVTGWGFADVRLPGFFTSNMVLQREMAIPIWGWADPNEQVTVSLGDFEGTAVASDEGKWQIKLQAFKAGGPFKLIVKAANTITLENVMLGDVWICSGQSNMQWGITETTNAIEEIRSADYPNIRLLMIPMKTSGMPVDDVNAQWNICSPETIRGRGWGSFSAVGYFFGQTLHKELDVPIGLIQSAWGGTQIEPWTNPEGFQRLASLEDISTSLKAMPGYYRHKIAGEMDAIETWLEEVKTALAEDKPMPLPPEWPIHPLNNNTKPTGIYNAMIYPLIRFGIQGVIWYQGESNCGDGMLYYDKMQALIEGWRSVWGQGDFPFYYVQIAPFYYNWQGDAYALPHLWEAQMTALNIPNTGIVGTMDVADLTDIHPRNKKPVGRRLALNALAQTYGRKDIVYSGPVYDDMAIQNGKIKIWFKHIGSGLASRDGKALNWFEIAGSDKRYVNAEAVIEKDAVIVYSSEVERPVAVRFGWRENAIPNLMNQEGLPAMPFRTHKW